MRLNRFLNLAVVVLLFVASPVALFAQAQFIRSNSSLPITSKLTTPSARC